MKSIELTDENGTYNVTLTDCGDSISEYFENMIIPVLLASGFSQSVIDSYIGKDSTE